MSYVWFRAVLEAIGKKINFESLSSLYGNSFAKDANDLIQSINPLRKIEHKSSIASILSALPVAKTVNSDEGLKDALGDIDWINETT